MTIRTHYEILGVSRQATLEEIKAAGRALLKKKHPDKQPVTGEVGWKARNDEAARIIEAYEVINIVCYFFAYLLWFLSLDIEGSGRTS